MKTPFESIVAEHGAVVLRVCRAVVGFSDADDAWSETFISAMKAYPELADDANIQAWLVTIAHRKAIDIIRTRKRGSVAVDAVPERRSSIGIPEKPGTEIWNFVKVLPDKQRQAVAYHYLGGLPFSDIAAILGGTTDAARRAAADGLKNLRRALAGANWKGESQ